MTWSSKQRLTRSDLVCLQDVLLGISLRLLEKDYNSPGIMTNITFEDMTRTISTRNMLEDILINLEND